MPAGKNNKGGASSSTPGKRRRRSLSEDSRRSRANSRSSSIDVQQNKAKKDTPVKSASGSKVGMDLQKYPPTMDVHVHRLRHLEYIPAPVLAMAQQSSTSSSADSYLALAREDGSYELMTVSTYEESKNNYTPRVTPVSRIAGSSLAVAHSLCWVNDACVAASPDGTIWIVNFSLSRLQSRFSSGGGGIFHLTTCKNATNLPLVAAACQDGSIRLWQVQNNGDGGKIQDPPLATLPTTGAPILSLAWKLVKEDRDGTIRTVFFAGVADGTIRKYNVVFSKYDDVYTLEKVTPGARMTIESRGRRIATKVWTLQILQDGTLVSGNSLGQVQFWNSDTGTLVQTMTQSELKADVLQVVVNEDETKIFASGVDSRVNCYERQKSNSHGRGGDKSWKLTTAQRPHTHDIKAMVMLSTTSTSYGKSPQQNQKSSQKIEVLASAGVDTKLCSYVVKEFSKRRPQVWYPWPSISPISTAQNQLLSMQRYDQIELYRLKKDVSKDDSMRQSSSALVGTVVIETQSNLVASTLSPNGNWLALSNATSLFVFRMNVVDGFVEPEKIRLPKSLERLCVVAIHFNKDTLYVADSSSSIYIIDLQDEDLSHSKIQIKQTGKKESFPIQSLHTSTDGSYLVAVNRLKTNAVHVFRRKNDRQQHQYQHYWTIPSLAGARPAALTLVGADEMAVATFQNHIFLFDLKKRQLSPWSEQNGFPIERWPSEMMNRKDFPVRLAVNPADPSKLVMASFGTFCVINLNETLPKHCRMVPDRHVRRRKRSREGVTETSQHNVRDDPTSRNCTICLHYNSMLYLDYLAANEMVVVEQPWLRVISTFPAALQRRVYGVN